MFRYDVANSSLSGGSVLRPLSPLPSFVPPGSVGNNVDSSAVEKVYTRISLLLVFSTGYIREALSV